MQAPAPHLELVHPRGTRHRGDLVLFADDSHSRRVFDPKATLEEEIEKLLADDECFDRVVGEGG